MPFLALGVEHKTAPLTVREAVTLNGAAVARTTTHVRDTHTISEIAILSTCNRTEFFLFAEDTEQATAGVLAYLMAIDSRVAEYLQTWEEMDAARHLFRVASGLESQALGEPQILSQVRDTLETAQRLESIGPNLHSLFRSAISCARQARAGTALGHVNISIGSQAVQAAEVVCLGSLGGRSALVIGGGAMARLVTEELRARGIGALFIANRTPEVAVELARLYGGMPAPLDALDRLLPVVDLVISATSAPHYVLIPEHLSPISRERPLYIYDLAMPRDVDPAVGTYPGVVLHDLDNLLPSGIAEHWDDDIHSMESIIEAEIQEFSAWYLTRRVAPVIASLRSHVEAVSEMELRRVAPQLAGLTDRERSAVESLTGRLIDKMFHHLVLRLRLAAQTDPKLVEAAEFFFLHGEGGLFEHAAESKQAMSHEL